MRALLVVLVLAVGCGKGDAGGGSGGSGSGSGTVAPVSDHVVEIFVNDKSVAKVTAAQLAAWPRVDHLVPEADRRLGTWKKLKLVGGKGIEMQSPSSSYPDKVPVLVPADGGAAFAMYEAVELANKGKAAFREDGVKEIRIMVSEEGRSGEHSGSTGDGDITKLVLTFETPDGPKTLTGPQIVAIEREEVDGQPGWKLSKLLATAGVADYTKLVLIDAAGTSIVLAKSDFDDTTKIPFVKLNKSGLLRFRNLEKAGEGWNAAGDLRALTTIKVIK
jgi:hypothetical protein